MTGKAYYITTLADWQRHAARFANWHWVALDSTDQPRVIATRQFQGQFAGLKCAWPNLQQRCEPARTREGRPRGIAGRRVKAPQAAAGDSAGFSASAPASRLYSASRYSTLSFVVTENERDLATSSCWRS